MDNIHLVAAHALHNAFIVTKRTNFDWPETDKEPNWVEENTILNVARILLCPPRENPFDAYDVWVAVTFQRKEDTYETEWEFPLRFLTERCEVLDQEANAISYF